MVKTRVTHKTLLFEGRREGDYLTAAIISNIVHWGGGEGSADERGGDARRKFWIKPLKETALGVAQALFHPYTKRDHVKT